MHALAIVFGCAIAYVTLAIGFGVFFAITGPEALMNPFMLSFSTGLVMFIPFTVVALIAGFVLARTGRWASAAITIAVSALGVTGAALLTAFLDPSLPFGARLIGTALGIGGLAGAVAWLGAFGLQRRVPFGAACRGAE